ncbi:hypothetical protein [Acinetobacter bereziniae]|uniref:hypothetical protein n=1 Tax=Acinetobacter bereziniae TaxID=106648 RepID=UPI0018DEA882|nr:hypothetical protein [Acinetobacter bereziniae]MBI0394828.1 hypothetical protein [Acinetobacter bereziniae]
MASKSKKTLPYFKVNGNTISVQLDTSTLFNNSQELTASPIDIYINRNKYFLMKLGLIERSGIITNHDSNDIDIYNLFLLGLVSNVESYFRRVIREIILADQTSYHKCLEQSLTYAAAIHHTNELLPEALLEHCSFISFENIKSTVNTFTGLSFGGQSIEQTEVRESIFLFEQLCQLRHCIVHRAGLLGSKNAIKLGLDTHKSFFEKPICLDLNFLQEASTICLNCVKSFNTFAFNTLINRYIENNKRNIIWNYTIDKKWFSKYYRLFTSEEINRDLVSQGENVYNAKKIYDLLRAYHR